MKRFTGKKALVAVLAAMMLLSGCSNTTNLKADPAAKAEIKLNEVNTHEYDEDKLNQGYGEFSFKMLTKLAENAGKKNIMISPASIMMALDMLSAGAKGETLKQLNELFAKDTDPLDQQAFASNLMKRINASQKLKFVCANAIWTNDSILEGKVNPEYSKYITKTFGAEFKASVFNGSTHEEINKWVDGKTNHMIPNLIKEPLSPDAAMVLVNAIRFEAQWLNGYADSSVQKLKFKGTDGDSDVSMLMSTEQGYFSSDKATGFIKYYEGEEYAFVAILPNDTKADANEFIKTFSYEDYKKFIKSRTSEDVQTMMPEFKSDYDADLNEALAKLGVSDAFLENKADFTGIAVPKEVRLHVSRVVHQSHIEVDRKGTKAAAATAVITEDEASLEHVEPKYVYCNRPYVYAIVDTVSMNPIFIGTVNNVK